MTTAHKRPFRGQNFLRKLSRDNSGLAIVEFAVSMPFFLGLSVSGIETARYAQAIMQLNQITIHTADSAARMGEANSTGTRMVTEGAINDIFKGVERESESLDLDGVHATNVPNQFRGNAKIWLSSIEPASTANMYKMRWQRCFGQGDINVTNDPNYKMDAQFGKAGTSATSSAGGFGPAGQQTTAPPLGATMFVETNYFFKPLIIGKLTRLTDRTISLHAAMVVRDNRDYSYAAAPNGPGASGVYPTNGQAAATC